MKNLPGLALLILLFAILISCGRNNNNQASLYKVTLRDFNDFVIVEGTVEALRSSSITCPNKIEGTIVYLIDDGEMVKKGDTVCVLEDRESTNKYENLINEVEQSKIQFTKGKADLEMKYALLESQVENNKAQTLITNLDTSQLKYLSPQLRKIKELELDIALIERSKLEKRLLRLNEINESELKKLELQIVQKENEATKIKSVLDQLVILAPQDGLAVRAKSWFTGNKMQEGDEVWSGMPLVDIPDLSEMKVVIQSTESAYKTIEEKKQVVYTFDAMPGNMAWGKIKKKAPMGKPIKRNSKVKYFEVNATIDSFKVIPDLGLSTNCRIILTQVKDTIVVPQLAIFDEDSIKVVYVKKNKKFEKREVRIGESSNKEAVVVVGLKRDEFVSFEKPKSDNIVSTVLLNDTLVKTDTLLLIKDDQVESVSLK